MADAEIAHADTADLFLLDEFFEGLPHLLSLRGSRTRAVDEE